MKQDLNNQNLCQFSDLLLDYLYGEIDAAESKKIEAHVSHCSLCALEFQSFNFSRSKIADWKKSSFDLLDTPTVAIHTLENKTVAAETASSLGFKNLLDFFRFKPVLAGSFAAVLLMLSFFIYFVSSSKVNDELAKNVESGNIPAIVEKDLAANKSANSIVENADNKTAINESKPSQIAEKNQADESNQIDLPKVSTVNIIKAKTFNHATTPQKSTEIVKTQIIENTNRVKKSAPSLLDEAEIEGENLRLSDLFAEVK